VEGKLAGHTGGRTLAYGYGVVVHLWLVPRNPKVKFRAQRQAPGSWNLIWPSDFIFKPSPRRRPLDHNQTLKLASRKSVEMGHSSLVGGNTGHGQQEQNDAPDEC
jgi:hypothetical protein